MAQTSPNLFLASSVNFVALDIAKRISKATKNKKLVFIPTAAEVEDGDLSWLHDDRQALVDAGFEVRDFTITGKSKSSIEKALTGAGAVCVAGGNTYYLLDQVRKSGFDTVIRRLISLGIPYIGSSAGSLLAGPSIETSLDDPKTVPELKDYTGIGLVDVAVRPHWGSPHFKERYRQEMDRLYRLKQKMILLNDYQYLLVQGESYQIILVKE